MYDRDKDRLEGFHLSEGAYRPLEADGDGRIWLESIGLKLGRWQGRHEGIDTIWVRLYDAAGRLIPTSAEAAEAAEARADAERAQTEAERARADGAEAEVARLRARLAEKSR